MLFRSIKRQKKRRKTVLFSETVNEKQLNSYNKNSHGSNGDNKLDNIPEPENLTQEEMQSIHAKIAELRQSSNPQTKRIATYVEQFIAGQVTLGRTHMWRILKEFREIYHGEHFES